MNVILNSDQQKLLEEHLKLVLFYNKTINITAIRSFKEGKILHIEDSIKPIHYIKYNYDFKVADIGSGAGYPGIPWSIITGLNTTLIETNQKKCKILESIVNELKLSENVNVYNGRIESIKDIKFDIITARALSSLSAILELASPILKINGCLVCYKSCDIQEEEKEAKGICELLGFKIKDSQCYKLSNNDPRKVIIYQKIKEAKVKLPRKAGFAQKKPFKN